MITDYNKTVKGHYNKKITDKETGILRICKL